MMQEIHFLFLMSDLMSDEAEILGVVLAFDLDRFGYRRGPFPSRPCPPLTPPPLCNWPEQFDVSALYHQLCGQKRKLRSLRPFFERWPGRVPSSVAHQIIVHHLRHVFNNRPYYDCQRGEECLSHRLLLHAVWDGLALLTDLEWSLLIFLSISKSNQELQRIIWAEQTVRPILLYLGVDVLHARPARYKFIPNSLTRLNSLIWGLSRSYYDVLVLMGFYDPDCNGLTVDAMKQFPEDSKPFLAGRDLAHAVSCSYLYWCRDALPLLPTSLIQFVIVPFLFRTAMNVQ